MGLGRRERWRRHGRRYGLAALLAFLYLYPFPYFEAMGSANELPAKNAATSPHSRCPTRLMSR